MQALYLSADAGRARCDYGCHCATFGAKRPYPESPAERACVVAHVVPDVNLKQNAKRKLFEPSTVRKCDVLAFGGNSRRGRRELRRNRVPEAAFRIQFQRRVALRAFTDPEAVLGVIKSGMVQSER
jgi:hypothetical protein